MLAFVFLFFIAVLNRMICGYPIQSIGYNTGAINVEKTIKTRPR